ncbi:MAG: GNAT family N-acetyltransferase [Clostridiales bacterium]|nr:GNAT family N-acetyltransferase [Clostridiales bacterium]MDR2749179.1 GNAT family N-acetyltransferase [Clostridiales bacterium]
MASGLASAPLELQRAGLGDEGVPRKVYWLDSGAGIVGAGILRLGLDEDLERSGGHLSMFILPGPRSLTLETKFLGLMLGAAAESGLKCVLMTCETDDVIGIKTAKKNGGVSLWGVKGLNSVLKRKRFLLETSRPYEIWRAPGFVFRMKPIEGKEIWLRLDETEPEEMTHCPAYKFSIMKGVRCVGKIDLRVGFDQDIYYCGNIGYRVYEEYRGSGYAAQAAQLLLPLAKSHGMEKVTITCNPDNIPSAKTCEKIGALYKELVKVSKTSDQYAQGDKFKRRYYLELA